MARLTIMAGDAIERLNELPDESVHCVVTSPPYWCLRDYGVGGQIGLEPTPEDWVQRLVDVFREVRRVLRKDGTLWLNVGDAYAAQRSGTAMPAETLAGGSHGHTGANGAGDRGRGWNNEPDGVAVGSGGRTPRRNASRYGLKHKDLIGLPWMLAFALRTDGWYLRSDIIWHKPNPMPESVTDRCTKSHEYVFMLAKSQRYFYDADAVKEPAIHSNETVRNNGGKNAQMGRYGQTRTGFIGAVTVAATRNKRDVWTIPPQPFAEAHFATFPKELPRTCILAGTSEQGACPDCGAPWDRVVEYHGVLPGNGKMHDGHRPDGMVMTGRDRPPTRSVLGWRPSCECGRVDTVPCVVLDPFLGSGTTALVALEMARDVIGIELNPEYAEMARKRCEAALRQPALL